MLLSKIKRPRPIQRRGRGSTLLICSKAITALTVRPTEFRRGSSRAHGSTRFAPAARSRDRRSLKAKGSVYSSRSKLWFYYMPPQVFRQARMCYFLAGDRGKKEKARAPENGGGLPGSGRVSELGGRHCRKTCSQVPPPRFRNLFHVKKVRFPARRCRPARRCHGASRRFRARGR